MTAQEFLSTKDQEEVENASKIQLFDAITDIACNLMAENPVKPLELDDFWLSDHSDSETNKLALIRHMCDRIETKLMEIAN